MGTPATWIGSFFLKKKFLVQYGVACVRVDGGGGEQWTERAWCRIEWRAVVRDGIMPAGGKLALAACIAWYGQIVPKSRTGAARRVCAPLVGEWLACSASGVGASYLDDSTTVACREEQLVLAPGAPYMQRCQLKGLGVGTTL